MVAGNHDVDRAADDDPDVKRLLEELRAGRASLDEALAWAVKVPEVVHQLGVTEVRPVMVFA